MDENENEQAESYTERFKRCGSPRGYVEPLVGVGFHFDNEDEILTITAINEAGVIKLSDGSDMSLEDWNELSFNQDIHPAPQPPDPVTAAQQSLDFTEANLDAITSDDLMSQEEMHAKETLAALEAISAEPSVPPAESIKAPDEPDWDDILDPDDEVL